MPKVTTPSLPLNGIFPIEKPTGPPSMKVIDKITSLLCDSKLFDDPEKVKHHNGTNKRKRNTTDKGLKIGQGGTLDPLADGVLVIGVNRGTKHLQGYLEGTKEYESIGLLGAATTTMDAEGAVLSTGNFDGITREDVEKALHRFNGEIQQTPPIFSALKMEGKPLYEYARDSISLPRPIPSRKCKVSIELLEFTPASTTPDDDGHKYQWPTERLSEEQKAVFRRLTQMVHEKQASSSETDPLLPDIPTVDHPEVSEMTGLRPPTFKVRMTVSGGTYVRSIVHDLGLALGCGAHVVLLRRTRQGRFALHGDEEALDDGSRQHFEQLLQGQSAIQGDPEEAMMNITKDGKPDAIDGLPAGPSTGCVPWAVFERALKDREEMLKEEAIEKEELMASGAGHEEVRKQFSYAELHKRRMEGPLKEWEYEVLRRFVAVPVPIPGGHSFRY